MAAEALWTQRNFVQQLHVHFRRNAPGHRERRQRSVEARPHHKHLAARPRRQENPGPSGAISPLGRRRHRRHAALWRAQCDHRKRRVRRRRRVLQRSVEVLVCKLIMDPGRAAGHPGPNPALCTGRNSHHDTHVHFFRKKRLGRHARSLVVPVCQIRPLGPHGRRPGPRQWRHRLLHGRHHHPHIRCRHKYPASRVKGRSRSAPRLDRHPRPRLLGHMDNRKHIGHHHRRCHRRNPARSRGHICAHPRRGQLALQRQPQLAEPGHIANNPGQLGPQDRAQDHRLCRLRSRQSRRNLQRRRCLCNHIRHGHKPALAHAQGSRRCRVWILRLARHGIHGHMVQHGELHWKRRRDHRAQCNRKRKSGNRLTQRLRAQRKPAPQLRRHIPAFAVDLRQGLFPARLIWNASWPRNLFHRRLRPR
eukprot:comp24323_c0_seq1/m.60124 comp24323_c0_seq1/g.60124  ORF comp24323_c0_seq1/g.60124 comp24323_c0_seq1/m.60124 type:complete len:419 (-) comp24323_c0_seq1:424-1680(-)